MRVIIAGAIAAAGVLSLAACGGQEPAPAQESSGTSSNATSAAPELQPVAFADLTGDAAAGKKIFMKCKTCHLLEEGQNRMGPHLYGVVGRKAGSVEGFNYSPANARSDFTWTPEVLFDYLEAPQVYLKGTRMAFPGIKNAQERADLVAYLEANGQV